MKKTTKQSTISPKMNEIISILSEKEKIIRITNTENDKLSKWTYVNCRWFNWIDEQEGLYTLDMLGKDIKMDVHWNCLGMSLIALENRGIIEFDTQRTTVKLKLDWK